MYCPTDKDIISSLLAVLIHVKDYKNPSIDEDVCLKIFINESNDLNRHIAINVMLKAIEGVATTAEQIFFGGFRNRES